VEKRNNYRHKSLMLEKTIVLLFKERNPKHLANEKLGRESTGAFVLSRAPYCGR
jgi:hypothetical protein